jgi:hypothetical protein
MAFKHGLWWLGAGIALTLLGRADGLGAQEAAAPRQAGDGALHVYYECSGARGACDSREFRTQIDWVNWVRDRRDAQVHVIITSVGTGSGGSQYRLHFIGREDLEGVEDDLTYTSLGTDVRDETVRGITRVLAIGLARFSHLAGSGAVLDVRQAEGAGGPTDRLVTSDEVNDPWNFWVFEVGVDGSFSGESTRKSERYSGDFEASRVTTEWKFNFEADGSWRESETTLSDNSVYVDTRRNWSAETGAAHSLASHWSLGASVGVSSATSTNRDFSVAGNTALEYSVWPYEEAPRRSLRVRYILGVRHYDYEEETVYGYLEETRGVESLEVSLSQRQPWGTFFGNVEGSHYLHDVSKYRLSTGGFLSFRVVRGVNIRVNGRVSWIRDQLFIPAEDISDEERLLQRRRLASNFDWDFGVGLSFQFGSIYNNVVNNRF